MEISLSVSLYLVNWEGACNPVFTDHVEVERNRSAGLGLEVSESYDVTFDVRHARVVQRLEHELGEGLSEVGEVVVLQVFPRDRFASETDVEWRHTNKETRRRVHEMHFWFWMGSNYKISEKNKNC